MPTYLPCRSNDSGSELKADEAISGPSSPLSGTGRDSAKHRRTAATAGADGPGEGAGSPSDEKASHLGFNGLGCWCTRPNALCSRPAVESKDDPSSIGNASTDTCKTHVSGGYDPDGKCPSL